MAYSYRVKIIVTFFTSEFHVDKSKNEGGGECGPKKAKLNYFFRIRSCNYMNLVKITLII